MNRLLTLLAFGALTGCIADNPATLDDAGPGDDATLAADAGPGDGAVLADGGEPGCDAGLEIAPAALAFPRGEAFETQVRELTVRNGGDCALTLSAVVINGSRTFRAQIAGADPAVDPAVLADPDQDGAPGLSPGASATIAVLFTPTDDAPTVGELEIVAGASYRVPLNGNQGACLTVEPAVAELRAAPGESRVAAITLTSCGDQPVEIQSVSLAEDSNAAFSLVPDDLPDLPLTLGPAGSDTQTAATLTVLYQPSAVGTVNGRLTIQAVGVAPAEVRLVGRAEENACPIAVTADDLVAALGDYVVLDGSASRDPDGPGGRPVEWHWRPIEIPDGAAGGLIEALRDPDDPAAGGEEDDPTTPGALYQVGVAGRYLFELVVVDDQGLSSNDCGTSAVLAVQAGGGGRLQFQLTWTTPADLDPDDARSSDVDLRVTYDGVVCDPANPTPAWPPEGPANDPVYDADVMRGGGPENVIVQTPQGDGIYRVEAVYDSDRGLGPSIATLRVFVDGVVVAQEQVELLLPGDVRGFDFRAE